jgi:hypothetical protein
MARIEQLNPAEMARNTIHSTAEASYVVFTGEDGRTYLQIDTYGSPGRDFPGKKSQSMQFGPEGLRQLSEIIRGMK